MKLFPCDSTGEFQPIFHKHLLKLSMPNNLKKWNKSYVNNCWDRNVLTKEHNQKLEDAEKELQKLGKENVLKKKNDDLEMYLKRLCYTVKSRTRKPELKSTLLRHMIRKRLWAENPHQKMKPDLNPKSPKRSTRKNTKEREQVSQNIQSRKQEVKKRWKKSPKGTHKAKKKLLRKKVKAQSKVVSNKKFRKA